MVNDQPSDYDTALSSIVDHYRERAVISLAIETAKMMAEVASGNPRFRFHLLAMRSYTKAADAPEEAMKAIDEAIEAAGVTLIDCKPGHERWRMPWGEETCAHCNTGIDLGDNDLTIKWDTE